MNNFFTPFMLSLSKHALNKVESHERLPFDKLRANGTLFYPKCFYAFVSRDAGEFFIDWIPACAGMTDL